MHVTVRLAEPFWHSIGKRDLELELAQGARVADLLALLCQHYPALATELTGTPPHIFVGEEEVKPETPLVEGSHVHLVWPVAGG